MRQLFPVLCIWLYPTNENEVSKTITNLSTNFSSGADAKNHVVLKTVAPAITRTAVRLINDSLNTGVFPEQPAVAKVNPLYKKRSK